MRYVTACLSLLLIAAPLRSYSVLTHEAIIDSAWDNNIKPLLIKRFPDATPQDLLAAHGYAYGGCILQDMGYYPFGSKLFTDMAHYVRTGDFVLNLIRESQNLNEYAFALGSLAHYAADTEGHAVAVNRAVPVEFRKLEREYGRVVTYEDDPSAHLRVEFGFDVQQVARGNYAPKSYHDFIGFEVSVPVLERAFHDTYSLELSDVFKDLKLAIGTYRHTVSGLVPEATKVAWSMNKKELRKSHHGITRRAFIYNLSRASYEKEWDREYERPGAGARFLAVLFRIVPKIGPFKFAAVKLPTPETTKMFEDSFDRTLDMYRTLLAQVGRGQLQLPNRDFDTGHLTQPTEYRMADDTYAKLVIQLEDKNAPIDPQLRANILAYFQNLDLPFATKKDPKQWQKTTAALDKLKSTTSAGGL